MKKINIVIAGEGGQGIQVIAKILTNAIAQSDSQVIYIPSFGVEQRGTPSIAFLTISDKEIRYPKFDIADIAVVLRKRAIDSAKKFINPYTEVIFDSSTVDSSDLPKSAVKLYGLPATKYAAENLSQRVFNIIVVGAIAKHIGLDQEVVWNSVVALLGKKFKNAKIEESNKKALEYGYSTFFEQNDFTKAVYKTRHNSIIIKGHGKSGEIIPARCKGCGICIYKCPVAALSFSDTLGVFATPVPQCDLEKCIGCGNCRAFCPDSAISISKDKE